MEAFLLENRFEVILCLAILIQHCFVMYKHHDGMAKIYTDFSKVLEHLENKK